MNNELVKCNKCNDTEWVCENHPDQEAHKCIHCGGAGMPCECTHPVNTCKHGVDDGACKECYIEVTHPANPYQSITDTKIEPTIVSYTHPAELTDEDYKEALACLQFALDDTMDYLTLNNLGGENNHWLVWARAILRKAQET